MHKQKKWWLAAAALGAILIILTVIWRTPKQNIIVIADHLQERKLVGGDCVYDSTQLGARVLKVKTYKDENASDSTVVMVEVVTKDRGADTVDLSKDYPYRTYTAEDWALSGLKRGDVIKCTYLKETNGGTCPPRLYRFLLERY